MDRRRALDVADEPAWPGEPMFLAAVDALWGPNPTGQSKDPSFGSVFHRDHQNGRLSVLASGPLGLLPQELAWLLVKAVIRYYWPSTEDDMRSGLEWLRGRIEAYIDGLGATIGAGARRSEGDA